MRMSIAAALFLSVLAPADGVAGQPLSSPPLLAAAAADGMQAPPGVRLALADAGGSAPRTGGTAPGSAAARPLAFDRATARAVRTFPVQGAPERLDGAKAGTLLATAVRDGTSRNVLEVVLGPLFPGRTDWTGLFPQDLPARPMVSSAPGWPGAWSVGVVIPRGE